MQIFINHLHFVRKHFKIYKDKDIFIAYYTLRSQINIYTF